MNPEALTSWANALSSGAYECHVEAEQSGLHDGKHFDFFGILCEVHRLKFGGEWIPDAFNGKPSYLGSVHFPPKEVLEWLSVKPWPVDDDGQPIDGVILPKWGSMYNRGASFADLSGAIMAHISGNGS